MNEICNSNITYVNTRFILSTSHISIRGGKRSSRVAILRLAGLDARNYFSKIFILCYSYHSNLA